MDLSYLESLDNESLDTLFGLETELILLIELVGSGGTNVGVFTTQSADLKATLYSKSSRSIVWENEASARSTGSGLYSVLAGGHKEKAIYKSVEHLLETLSPARED